MQVEGMQPTCSCIVTSGFCRRKDEMRRGMRYVPVVWLAPRHTTPVLAQLRHVRHSQSLSKSEPSTAVAPVLQLILLCELCEQELPRTVPPRKPSLALAQP